jgi:DNA-binding NtrC family response regulator
MHVQFKQTNAASDWSGMTLESKHEGAASGDKRRPRLLVVDDEKSICFALSEYFALQGFNVDTAGELGEAVELVNGTNYEVIIQDLRLGATRELDGLYIVKLAHERHPETRIIVLTAFGSAGIENEALRCGASAFLRKPRPLSQLAQVVQVLIESRAETASIEPKSEE